MQRVSSNLTILLKIFIPIFWSVFFGAFTIALWFEDHIVTGALPLEYLRYGMTLFFLIGIVFFYFTVIQLKRIEMDADFLYATNYIKTVRYPWSEVEKVDEKDFLVLKTGHITLKAKGLFGKKLTFLVSSYRLQGFLNKNPEVVAQLNGKA